MDNCVIVENAVKRFKENVALDHVSVSFERGKIHGIIGRNGSGKTVLFKCICGFMRLDQGKIYVNGSLVRPSASQDIGIMIEDPGFIGNMSGFRNLKLLASVNQRITDGRIREVMQEVGLDPASKKHVCRYSLGMRHRLGIAQAIMEDQRLLILDEPMNGLDKQGVAQIRRLLLEMKKQGKTVILSSHYAEDIETLCDTVHEMDGGRMESARMESARME